MLNEKLEIKGIILTGLNKKILQYLYVLSIKVQKIQNNYPKIQIEN